MTSDKRPREFWIDDRDNGDGYVTQNINPIHFQGEVIHVIEYSAYVALKKENEELKAKVKELTYMQNENHNCPLCDSPTEMRQYEYHPDMKGPKPYDIICTNSDCGHAFMPSFVEHHINNFEMLKARKENQALRKSLALAVEALEFYADSNGIRDNETMPNGLFIAGKKARQTLAKIKAKNGEL
jgi:hypothetical protein